MKLFVRDLTVIDASYLSVERGMVGESWILDVVMSGELNEMSMVLDFSRVKKQIKQLVDQFVDHRLIVPTQNSAIKAQQVEDGYFTVDLLRGDNSIYLKSPEQAFCFIDAQEVTIETVTKHLHNVLSGHMPANVEGLELTLRHEKIDGAFYHYSHGLKKHDGNCQRIAHGHRSPIELLVNGQRHSVLEQEWAERWQDIYLAAEEDVVELSLLDLSENAQNLSSEQYVGFSYQAPQGKFDLAIAKNKTEILPTDTTVELLAYYIAQQVKPKLDTNDSLDVFAYEGVGKGAMASL
ncbi:6-carboxytetrahydropterin synthase [Photobacterium damselae]|uniref:6-carboxytetrahydropterin synthase n=1 Tax=Photobacterium damselae TaxID=38293 RepID=UPI002542E909|nr:6-carboxytetrahydropterin synthase [Photobacterium damselae]ELI6448403.1 6-carboxytetrahydropterin synthase [Photobacterium damselae]ELV7518537.1 6-carboxytetrahydropterin synthase [Photobacterium damselae]WIH21692.1 6-carboxytetrahydropterin synthase [Photobacterium damselae]